MTRLVPQESLMLRVKMSDLRLEGVYVLPNRVVAIESQIVFILRKGRHGISLVLYC